MRFGLGLLCPPRGLVFQASCQPSPAVGHDCAVEPRLLPHIPSGPADSSPGGPSHRPHVEVLDANQVEPAGKVGRGLLHPILTPVFLPARQPRRSRFGAPWPVRPRPTTRDLATQASQPPSFAGCQSGNCQQFARGQVVAIRLSEVPQRLLLHRNAPGSQPRELRTRLGQLVSLLVVTGCRSTARPPVRMLLARHVPHVPGMRAVLQQPGLLTRRRQQPIAGHEHDASGGHRQNPMRHVRTGPTGVRCRSRTRVPARWEFR